MRRSSCFGLRNLPARPTRRQASVSRNRAWSRSSTPALIADTCSNVRPGKSMDGEKSSMRFAVIGAGGIGGYFGAGLSRAGHDVRLFARGEHLEAIRSRGLEVREPEGTWIAKPAATSDPGELGPVDVVLVSVKSYSLAE